MVANGTAAPLLSVMVPDTWRDCPNMLQGSINRKDITQNNLVTLLITVEF
jgi:hypothetical protein